MGGPWSTVHEPNYEKYQSGKVTGLIQGAAAIDLQQLPAINTALLRKPNKIILQGHPDNSGPILVGKTSPLPMDGSSGGFYLAPGEMQVLPDNDPTVWYLRGTGVGGQAVMYTYLAEPS